MKALLPLLPLLLLGALASAHPKHAASSMTVAVRFACAPKAERVVDFVEGLSSSVEVPPGCQSAGEVLQLDLSCGTTACHGSVTPEFGEKALLEGPRARIVAQGEGAKRSLLLAGLQLQVLPFHVKKVDATLLPGSPLRVKVLMGQDAVVSTTLHPGERGPVEIGVHGQLVRLVVQATRKSARTARVEVQSPEGRTLLDQVVALNAAVPLPCTERLRGCVEDLSITVTGVGP